MIIQLNYSKTNTYLIRGGNGSLLFDTGWAGTFPLFCRELKKQKAALQEIKYLLISHYHPDHMGIAQDIAEHGVTIIVPEIQRGFIHSSDSIFEKENKFAFTPVCDKNIRYISLEESRAVLAELGIDGEMLYTPGHSDDSVSLWLDEGAALVGDLAPLYELELHRGTQTEQSWNIILERKPSMIYYGHAKAASLTEKPQNDKELYSLTARIIKCIDRGYTVEKIQAKTGADAVFINDVARMYLTHRNVSIQGILDRIEIKGK